MKLTDIARLRLTTQRLVNTSFTKPEEVVVWLGAVQAQDYLGSLWAIGQRIKSASEAGIEKAIEERKIVRTWPMRGTLHFVMPEDVRWMLKLLTPRVFTRASTNYRLAQLDKKVFVKSAKLIERALKDEHSLTRDEIYKVLEQGKISTKDTRGLHITGYLAMEGLICIGPRKGKQPTFVLLDEWIPKSKTLSTDESLFEIAHRYFLSHGPATLNDFIWWTGLTVKDAARALEMVKSKFTSVKINDQEYWMSDSLKLSKTSLKEIHLIPAYDEFLVSYKDRSASVDSPIQSKVRNSIFSPAIINDGQLIGTWKRTLSKKEVNVDIIPYYKLNDVQERSIQRELKRYSRFVGLDLK